MREAVVEQEVSRVHMPRIDVAKLAAVQQQSKDSSRSSMAATGQETFLPVPLPGVEAADAIDTVSDTWRKLAKPLGWGIFWEVARRQRCRCRRLTQ